MIALLAALAGVARADCDSRALAEAVARAEAAFVEMDESAFVKASSDADVTVECLADVLSPVQVAGLHRVHALGAFLRGDHPRATLEFRAVLGTQPGYALPAEIAPLGHPLRDDFEASRQFADGEGFPLPAPAEGWLLVDGQRATQAPGGRPFLLQWLDDEGVVVGSARVDVGGVLPKYPRGTPAPAPAPAPSPSRGGGRPLLWAGVGTVVAGGAAYGAAFAVRARYLDAVRAGDEPVILRTHTQTNVLAGAGVALLAGGAALTLVGAF